MRDEYDWSGGLRGGATPENYRILRNRRRIDSLRDRAAASEGRDKKVKWVRGSVPIKSKGKENYFDQRFMATLSDGTPGRLMSNEYNQTIIMCCENIKRGTDCVVGSIEHEEGEVSVLKEFSDPYDAIKSFNKTAIEFTDVEDHLEFIALAKRYKFRWQETW